MSVILKFINKIKYIIYPAAGSFFIVGGWNWYHLNKHNHLRFCVISIAMWVGLLVFWFVFKRIYRYFTIRFRRHPWWQNEFYGFLDELYITASLVFLSFFSRNELLTLGIVGVVFLLLFWQSDHFLKKHPDGSCWVRVNRVFFLIGLFTFLISGLTQYWSYYYYILDPSALFFNVVFFRALSFTIFWLFFLALANIGFWILPRGWRYAPVIFWAMAYILYLVFWVFNAGILYFSDLYLSPIILAHAEGGAGVVFNKVSYEILAVLAVILPVFLFLFRKYLLAQKLAPRRYWYYYNFLIIFAAVGIFLGISSFWTTPEATVVKSFYKYWFGTFERVELNPVVKQKLEKFGLKYNTDEFFVARRDSVYTSTTKLLPARFVENKPNVMVVLWESGSARMAGVYNPKYTDLTPGLDNMAADPHTTIFKNYFNASTPTVTGLISGLCSILPPMGHNEIQNENRLQKHNMLCLPKMMLDNGYKYASYITAVDKNFAHKNSIFESMGVQEFYGTEELYEYIPGEPLSWGWSDHQLFPVTWKFLNEKAKEPFLVMLSTVDTHPPFTLAKDMVKYKDGNNEVLNSFHTTDDAFKGFWEQFKNSKFYDDTILIVVADHAIFPAAFKSNQFPDLANKLTFYDENMFLMYIPDNILPKVVDTYSSEIDLAPTVLQILGINTPNNFEGRSIFDDRNKFPNLLGMHEFGLWINRMKNGQRKIDFIVPHDLQCDGEMIGTDANAPLTMCEYENYYKWKRSMFEEGRFWFQ